MGQISTPCSKRLRQMRPHSTIVPARDLGVGTTTRPKEAGNARSHSFGATITCSTVQASDGGERGMSVILLVNQNKLFWLGSC